MWTRRISCLVLMLLLVGPAYAQNNWTNATGNGSWVDPNNWSEGVVPGPGTGNTRINPDTNLDPNHPIGPTIGPGQLAVTDAMDVWGPEFGPISLNIVGGSYTSPAYVGLVSVNDNPDARPSVNMGDGDSGGWLDVDRLLIGHSWWYTGGPYTSYNQWSGTAILRIELWLGGKLNLYGGVMYVFGAVVMATDVQSPDVCTLNIEGGTLMLPVDYAATVQDWVTNGYCVAYGGTGEIVVEETPDWTKVTAVPAPPAE